MKEILIPLVGITVASGTAFLIAYWQRKQMRQIEEYRCDPGVGLRPPPSRLWVFVRTNIDLITGVALPLFLLILELFKPHPLTRWAVFFIAFYVGSIFYTLASHLALRVCSIVIVQGDILNFARITVEMISARLELLETDDPEEKARKRGRSPSARKRFAMR